MKRFLILGIALVAVATLVSESFAGTGKFNRSGIEFSNLNEWDGTEESDIRIWILDEEQIQNPPTTREEADGVMSYVVSPFSYIFFSQQPGTYFVVASNESHYQSLEPDDSFTPGEDFSLLEVMVESRETVGVTGENTDTPTLLPELLLE